MFNKNQEGDILNKGYAKMSNNIIIQNELLSQQEQLQHQKHQEGIYEDENIAEDAPDILIITKSNTIELRILRMYNSILKC